MVRRILLRVHPYIGLVTGIILFVLALTGSALVFENEIDRALNPSLFFVTPGSAALPVQNLIERIRAASPIEAVVGIRLAERPDVSYEMALRNGRALYINQ